MSLSQASQVESCGPRVFADCGSDCEQEAVEWEEREAVTWQEERPEVEWLWLRGLQGRTRSAIVVAALLAVELDARVRVLLREELVITGEKELFLGVILLQLVIAFFLVEDDDLEDW